MLLNFPKKTGKNIWHILKDRHYVSHETLRLLYYSLFYSYISYGISVWGLTHPTVLDPLYKLQKKVVRAITFNNKYTHTTPLFYDLRLLKIHEIHSSKLLCFVYDCKQGSLLQPFSDSLFPFILFMITTHGKHTLLRRASLHGPAYFIGPVLRH